MDAMWMIYLADVLDGFDTLLKFMGVIIIVITFGSWVSTLISASDANNYSAERYKKTYENCKSILQKMLHIFLPISVFLFVIVTIIPSKDTIYMMAAAKVGQDVVTSPEAKQIGGKLIELINKKLDDTLKSTEKKEK